MPEAQDKYRAPCRDSVVVALVVECHGGGEPRRHFCVWTR